MKRKNTDPGAGCGGDSGGGPGGQQHREKCRCRRQHILVAYFSATGNTKAVAETAPRSLRGDIFRIIPEERYSEDDLGHGADARVTREQADPNSRPTIKNRVGKLGPI